MTQKMNRPDTVFSRIVHGCLQPATSIRGPYLTLLIFHLQNNEIVLDYD